MGKLVLNSEGIRAMLTSSEMMSVCRGYAEEINASMGAGDELRE